MKFKLCVLASILGLFNVVPGNVNARFVVNQNYPYFFNQADHLEEGLWWFRSKTNPKEVFFIVVREYNEISQKKAGISYVGEITNFSINSKNIIIKSYM